MPRMPPLLLLVLALATSLCACETQQSTPVSAGRFGPPTFMNGNPMETGFSPTSGLGGYSVPSNRGDSSGSIPTSSNPLPSGWHGFGGS